jgi:hypothetical protein
MPGLVPGIHDSQRDACRRPVDGRAKPGQDVRVELLLGSEHEAAPKDFPWRR